MGFVELTPHLFEHLPQFVGRFVGQRFGPCRTFGFEFSQRLLLFGFETRTLAGRACVCDLAIVFAGRGQHPLLEVAVGAQVFVPRFLFALQALLTCGRLLPVDRLGGLPIDLQFVLPLLREERIDLAVRRCRFALPAVFGCRGEQLPAVCLYILQFAVIGRTGLGTALGESLLQDLQLLLLYAAAFLQQLLVQPLIARGGASAPPFASGIELLGRQARVLFLSDILKQSSALFVVSKEFCNISFELIFDSGYELIATF